MWTSEEDAIVTAMYAARKPIVEIASALRGRTVNAVRNRAHDLRVADVDKWWTAAQVDMVRAAYAAAGSHGLVDLDALAVAVGRMKSNVCRKARELGLTNQRRTKVDDEGRAEMSTRAAKTIRERGHPRGALGMRHTAVARAVMGEKHRANWRDPSSKFNTPEFRQRRSDAMHGRMIVGGRVGHSRCKIGKRADLGNVLFRSAWEANYARYLNWLAARGEIVRWEYEVQVFEFLAVRRGVRSYRPDFKVHLRGGGHEWHEVKGWMDEPSKVRLALMAKYFPNERVIVIDKAWMSAATRQGIPMLVGNWE